MRKLVVGMMVGVMVAGFALGQQMTNDERARAAMLEAEMVFKTGDFAGAQTAYAKVATDYPGASAQILAGAHSRVGMCLDRQLKNVEARAAYDAALALDANLNTGYLKLNSLLNYSRDYETGRAYAQELLTTFADGRVDMLAAVQGMVALSYSRQRNFTAAQAAYAKVLQDYPSAPAGTLALARFELGNALAAQGKRAEANAAYMACVETYVWELGAADRNGIIWRVFERISPMLADASAYRTFLENTIKATKAVEENAEFLGRLKSELSKMQS